MDEAATRPATPERRSPTPGAARKREAIRQLKAAMEEGRILLHYQPIVTARDSRIASVEALLRWRAPESEGHGLTPLIWAAEHSPVIFRLEHWTLGEAFRAAAAWAPAGGPRPRLNVNLSAREFVRPGLSGRLTRQLRAAGLDPGAVALEITETSRMEAFAAVTDHLRRFADMGTELWLDDFGTGHSSLAWLSHLPIQGLKIAGTFVERVLTERRCQVIVRRVIEMAHDLGLRVAAEGVETEAQRRFLLEHDCDLLQGYLLHAPMPGDAIVALLAGAPPAPPSGPA
jgi:EAL domain-containing protein (putative c-di-GMP-specific phosphodiesterase class I)